MRFLATFLTLLSFSLAVMASSPGVCSAEEGSSCDTTPYTNWPEDPTLLVDRSIRLGSDIALVGRYSFSEQIHLIQFENGTEKWLNMDDQIFSVVGEEEFLWSPQVLVHIRSDEPNSKVNAAAWLNDLEEVKRLYNTYSIKRGKRDRDGFTSLHWAAHKGHTDILRFLINEKGEYQDPKDKNGWTPLHWAVWNNRRESIDFLLSVGADFEDGTKEGWTPLFQTIERNNPQLAAFFIGIGAKVNNEGKKFTLPTHHAAGRGRAEILKLLLDNGGELEPRDYMQQTPLHLAAYFGHLEAAKVLVEAGCEIDVLDNKGRTPLDMAWNEEYEDVAEYLKEQGADFSLVQKRPKSSSFSTIKLT